MGARRATSTSHSSSKVILPREQEQIGVAPLAASGGCDDVPGASQHSCSWVSPIRRASCGCGYTIKGVLASQRCKVLGSMPNCRQQSANDNRVIRQLLSCCSQRRHPFQEACREQSWEETWDLCQPVIKGRTGSWLGIRDGHMNGSLCSGESCFGAMTTM
jgi:hypothetical protein